MKGYNRADLLSLRGVAREVAAITDSRVIFKDEEAVKTELPKVAVDIENENLSPVYCVAKIENLKVEHSDEIWVKKLSDSGIRTINNIADVTNLIMVEYGQPMHAFDTAKVADQTLIVRVAKRGERLTTLDNKVRNLDETDLLIADSQKPLGLAGVMGGKDSEISDSTTTILLEAAIFDPISIRQTVQRHNLPSEAAKRFQHGLTKTNLLQALSAAIKMYEGLGGELTAISLIGDIEYKPKKVHLTQAKITSLIGINIPPDQIKKYLQSLGFHLRGVNVNSWEVTVPYWRLDIEIEVDLIEEIARMYGYEKIPAKELSGDMPEKIDQSLPNFIYILKKELAEAGLTEVQTYSFYSTKVLSATSYQLSDLIKIANPISAETEYMRDNLWPNLVEVVGRNIKQGYKDIAVFEIGKVYIPVENDMPKESYRLSIALMNGTDNPIEELAVVIATLNQVQGKQSQDKIAVSPSAPRNDIGKALFHPTRFATIQAEKEVIGNLAEVHPRIVNKFGISGAWPSGLDQRVAILEINLEELL